MVGGGKGGRAATGLVLALCMAAALLEGFDNQTLGAVAPRLLHALHLAPADPGWRWVLMASTVGLLIGAAIGGRMADRFGFRRVLVSTIALMGLASCATVFADDTPTLFAARFLTGLGLGGSMPNVLALVSGSVPQARRGAAVSAIYAGMPFGGAISAGATLFGAAEEWRTVFLIGGLIPLMLAPALLLLPERAGSAAKPGPERGPERVSERAPGRAVAPVTEVLFGEGRALATVLLWFSFPLTLLILYLMLNWLPTLTALRGYGRETVALVQTAFNLGGALACLSAGVLLDGARRRGFVVAVYGLLGLSLAGLATLNAGPALEIALGGVLGVAVMLAQTVLYDAAPRLYPAAVRGTGVGWAVAFGRIGAIAGPWLGGMLVAHGATPSQVLMRLTPVVALAGVGTLLHEWRARRARVDASEAQAA